MRSKSDGLRPHSIGRTSRRTPRVHGRTRPLFIGQTSLALPRVNRTDSHSESPRPLSHGRISPALGSPTPIQPFPNPDMDGINRHSTTTQPSFVSKPRTIPTQPSHIRSESFASEVQSDSREKDVPNRHATATQPQRGKSAALYWPFFFVRFSTKTTRQIRRDFAGKPRGLTQERCTIDIANAI